MMYEINKKFSNSTYTILKKSNYKISKKFGKMHTWINNINKRILPKKANYADDYEYSHTEYLKIFRIFYLKCIS